MKFITVVEQQLGKIFVEAMRMVDRMKAEGASKDDRESYVAGVLREAWPKGRTQPWRYICEPCRDTGWLYKTCIRGSCGRPFRFPRAKGDDWTGKGHCTGGHPYVEPCSCEKGQVQRRQLLRERSSEDALETAARTSKPTRIGR